MIGHSTTLKYFKNKDMSKTPKSMLAIFLKTKYVIHFVLVGFLLSVQGYSQDRYGISIDNDNMKISSEHLKMGGKNLQGKSIDVNNYFITINDEPVIPVTGEFHYSRYPNKYWEEAIQKMKAGGITMIATYVFWSIHEEREGEFNWEGDNNLRQFIELCAKNNIDAIVRIGPFCHGEIRNGGLPDWLLGKPLSIRSNDPRYLFYVERLYNQIGKQLEGLLFKDGGPVIAIQLENEYQHSAAPWGLHYPGQPLDFTSAERDRTVTQAGVGVSAEENPYAELGNEHMRVLKNLAIKAGLQVPVYTATGWGNAAVIDNETLPVTAAYPFPTWSSKKLSGFYLYTNLQKDPDYAPVRYKAENYPYFAAELGGGIMNTYSRRPLVPARGLDAMINRFLGSGTNGLGYYMYHGGSTPRGKDFYFSDEAYAYPKISYDFQAPIGEYGHLRASFHRLKLVHFFLQDFGDVLAPMKVSLPGNYETLRPENVEKLRYSVRSRNGSGFIFMNNFQDHAETEDISDIQFNIETSGQELLIPESGALTLKKEENMILPFNIDLSGIGLNYATAQLMTKGEKGQYYVFFAPEGILPEFSIKKQPGLSVSKKVGCSTSQNNARILVKCNAVQEAEFTVKKADGSTVNFLVLSKEMALRSWKINLAGKKHLVFSEATVLSKGMPMAQGGNLFRLLSEGKNQFNLKIYPKTSLKPRLSKGEIEEVKSGGDINFSNFQVSLPEANVDLKVEKVTNNKFMVNIPDSTPEIVSDIILKVDYTGDTGMGFLNGKLVADNFYNGLPWEIGLKKFIDNLTKPENMVFYFRPLYKDAPFYEDFDDALIPDFNNSGSFFELKDVIAVSEYGIELHFH